jgi:Gpi18-like mannosyltransferase
VPRLLWLMFPVFIAGVLHFLQKRKIPAAIFFTLAKIVQSRKNIFRLFAG